MGILEYSSAQYPKLLPESTTNLADSRNFKGIQGAVGFPWNFLNLRFVGFSGKSLQ